MRGAGAPGEEGRATEDQRGEGTRPRAGREVEQLGEMRNGKKSRTRRTRPGLASGMLVFDFGQFGNRERGLRICIFDPKSRPGKSTLRPM